MTEFTNLSLPTINSELLKLGEYRGFGPLGRQPIWLQTIEVYLLGDFIGYWTHRLFHTGKWWPFHAVHHSSEDLDWLASLRVHPVNDFVNKLAQASFILLLGFNPFVTASLAPVFTFYAIFLHANATSTKPPAIPTVTTTVESNGLNQPQR